MHIPHPKCLGHVSVIWAMLDGRYGLCLRRVRKWEKLLCIQSYSCNLRMEREKGGMAPEILIFRGHHQQLWCFFMTLWVAGCKVRLPPSLERLQMLHPGVSLSVSLVWYEFRETQWLSLWRKWGAVVFLGGCTFKQKWCWDCSLTLHEFSLCHL